jgi:hypothetical protein
MGMRFDFCHHPDDAPRCSFALKGIRSHMGERRQPQRKQSPWQQLPTWLTAVAAFITALGGAWAVFGPPSPSRSTPTTTTSTTLPHKDPGKVTISSILPKVRGSEAFYEVAGVWRPVSSEYDVRVVGRPEDDQRAPAPDDQWVLSDPARVESDGSWTATLTVAKALRDKVVISAVVISKVGAPLLEGQLRASGPAAPGVAGRSPLLTAPPRP